MFNESARVLFMSQGETEAWDMVTKAKFIYDKLPDFLRLTINHSLKSGFDWEAIHSDISALASTIDAGRSTDATLVARDEISSHPYAMQNYNAVSPTIDSGGQLIDLGTIDAWNEDNYFTQKILKIYHGGVLEKHPTGVEIYRKDGIKAVLVFLGWHLRPIRTEGMTLDEWWNNEIVPKYSEFERFKNYPRTLEEALSSPQSVCRFDIQGIKAMKEDIDSPKIVERNGIVQIYKQGLAGRKYCMVIDSAEGADDPAVGGIFDSQTNERVAGFEAKIPRSEQAVIAMDLYDRYFKPFTSVERNAAGISLIEVLQNMGLKNWYFDDKRKEKAGIYTHSANRPIFIQDLAEAVRLNQIVEHNEQAIKQFTTFIRTEKKPEGEARGGAHDDYVMMWGHFLKMKKAIPSGNYGVIASFKYGG